MPKAVVVVRTLPRQELQVVKAQERERHKAARLNFRAALDVVSAGDIDAGIELLSMAIAGWPECSRYVFERGQCFFAKGLYDNAMVDIDSAIALEGTRPFFHERKADTYLKQGDKVNAIACLEDAIFNDPDGSSLMIKRADLLMTMKKFEEAYDGYHEAVEALGRKRQINIEAFCKRAKCAHKLGLLGDAVADLEHALTVNPTDIPAIMALAEVHIDAMAYAAAVERLTQGLDLDRRNHRLHNLMGDACFGAAEKYRKMARKEKDDVGRQVYSDKAKEQLARALECYDVSLQLSPTDPETFFHRGQVRFYHQQWESALSDFKQAQSLGGTNSVQYLHFVGRTHFSKGDVPGAITAYHKAIELDPEHVDTLLHLGHALWASSRAHDAIHVLTDALKHEPKNVEVLDTRGAIFRDIMDHERALEDLDNALRMDENRASVYFHRAQVLMGLQRFDEARESMTEALQRGYDKGEVWNWFGLIYRQEGQYEAALDALNQAIEVDAKQARFYYNRAQVLRLAARGQEGLQHAHADLTEALTHDPGCLEYFYIRGLVSVKLERYEDAITDLKAAQTGQSYAKGSEMLHDTLYHLGLAHTGLHQYKQAVDYLTEALDCIPDQVHVLHERAKALQDDARSYEALMDFNEVIRIQPDNANAYFRRGFVHKQARQYDEAADDFEMAKKLQPGNSSFWLDYHCLFGVQCIALCKPGEERRDEKKASRRPTGARPKTAPPRTNKSKTMLLEDNVADDQLLSAGSSFLSNSELKERGANETAPPASAWS